MGQALKTYNRSDPTQTITLRKRFAAAHRKRFRHLRGVIRTAIIERDVFGIRGGHEGLQGNVSLVTNQAPPNNAFDFPRMQDKISAFMEWLEDQVEEGILDVQNKRMIGEAIENHWQNIYIRDTYKRGIQRAAYEMENIGMNVGIQNRGGVDIVMTMPAHLDRLGVLYTRAFNELKGITDAMDQQISRILAQGLADGDGPRLLARKLTATIGGPGATPGSLGITDSLGRFIPAQRRAEILARTEIIRAHHQGMMQTYRNWGVAGVNVKAELTTAGDSRVCEECWAIEANNPYTLDEIENLIPVHPQCRCIALPVREEDIEE